MRPRKPDLVSLVAGLCLMAIGGLLLADRLGGLHLTFGWLWPAVCAAAGVVLLAGGASQRRGR